MNIQISARQQVEAEIERLIAILDAMDGDTDHEPSLGWPAAAFDITTQGLVLTSGLDQFKPFGGTDDREEEHDR